jgi:hypothetical protein
VGAPDWTEIVTTDALLDRRVEELGAYYGPSYAEGIYR